MHACMYCMRIYVCACIYVYMHVCISCMYICMHLCKHICIYVIFKLGFERYGGNCPSWEGELSGGELSRGNCPGELSGGNCPGGKGPGPPNSMSYDAVLLNSN